MISIEYSEEDDMFFYVCDCGDEGILWDEEYQANLDADRHDLECAV